MSYSARIDELEKKFSENARRYFAPLANEYRKAGDVEQAGHRRQERATTVELLLHGFTGSPWDVRPLGEALAARERGVDVWNDWGWSNPVVVRLSPGVHHVAIAYRLTQVFHSGYRLRHAYAQLEAATFAIAESMYGQG